jgi:hypothetical protein
VPKQSKTFVGYIKVIAVAAPAHVETIRTFANANPNPEIGTTPPFFDGNVDGLQLTDILKLIQFYNDDMGMTPADGLTERIAAVRGFLIEL